MLRVLGVLEIPKLWLSVRSAVEISSLQIAMQEVAQMVAWSWITGNNDPKYACAWYFLIITGELWYPTMQTKCDSAWINSRVAHVLDLSSRIKRWFFSTFYWANQVDGSLATTFSSAELVSSFQLEPCHSTNLIRYGTAKFVITSTSQGV